MRPAVVALSALLAGPAAAQTRDTPFRVSPQIVITPGGERPQPFVGFDTREVKTLPAQRQEALRQGRPIHEALPAEMNGYPSPVPALELADQLGLNAEQRARIAALIARTRKEAIAAGEALLAAEAHLDRMFATQSATPERVEAQTAVVAAQEARLRAIHLNAHVAMLSILTPEQIESFNRLKSYVDAPAPEGPAAPRR